MSDEEEGYFQLNESLDCGDELMMTQENISKYESFGWWISGLLVMVIACYGILINFIAIPILLRRRIHTRTVIMPFLCFQIVFDILYLICNVSEAISILYPSNIADKITNPVINQLKNICLFCSIGIKVVLIHDRHTLLPNASSLQERQQHSNQSPIYVIARIMTIIICSILISIPLFYEAKIESVDPLLDLHLHDAFNETIGNITSQPLNGSNILADEWIKMTNGTSTNIKIPKLELLLPTKLRFSYHYMIWYRALLLTVLPLALLSFYVRKVYNSLKAGPVNEALDTVISRSLTTGTVIELSELIGLGEESGNTVIRGSLTTGSANERSGLIGAKEVAGILCMVAVFILCYATRILLLIYEIINLKWIQNNFSLCLVPLVLFYGKSVYDLLLTVNATISIYLFIITQTNHRILNFLQLH